jgi:7,8-dihydropterin-6-yl-methyl-4-(beta-D-ribofuranosyl)aminobenzene 5'-phosphate synthase
MEDGLSELVDLIPVDGIELVVLSPDLVVPGHCTGWKATHAVSNALPDASNQSNLGTTFSFHADQPSNQT